MDSAKIIFKSDAFGNVLYAEGNAIFLQKANNAFDRLGSFDIESKKILMNKEHYDLNERFKCYPFNEAILTAAKKCDTVHLVCPEGRFDIPIEVILKFGTVLIYDKPGLSKEIFVELSLIKKYTAK